VHFVEF